jgi:hypothetical protein
MEARRLVLRRVTAFAFTPVTLPTRADDAAGGALTERSAADPRPFPPRRWARAKQ